jgi:hypothetical protein
MKIQKLLPGQLRDRIVNQGMQPLIETEAANPYQIYEAEEAGVGGKSQRH